MSFKLVVRQQYQSIINDAAEAVGVKLTLPNEGWVATTRKALGMTAISLAKRLEVTRTRTYQIEKDEMKGSVTLKTMQETAGAMGCRFIYAIIPLDGKIEDIIYNQARKKAKSIVQRAHIHMSLEQQSLSTEENDAEIERIAKDLIQEMPKDFWQDKWPI